MKRCAAINLLHELLHMYQFLKRTPCSYLLIKYVVGRRNAFAHLGYSTILLDIDSHVGYQRYVLHLQCVGANVILSFIKIHRAI